uniref:DUF1844 domain-containing protein n=1 Tax=Dissulfurimicrobium sp. TaxID=2022436 RepID=UPI00404A1854
MAPLGPAGIAKLAIPLQTTQATKNKEIFKMEHDTPLPQVTFQAFILSLNTSALFYLGEIPDPANGEKKKDLAMARYTIDTLLMLRDKTKGNLEDDEKRLLETILFDVQLRFVIASK